MLDIDWKEILGWDEKHLAQARAIGYLYYKQGAFDIAALCFEALLTCNPHALYELQTLGAIYLDMNRAKEALMFFDRALNIDPAHEATLFNRCKALFAIGERAAALETATLLEKSRDPRIAKSARSWSLVHLGQNA